ncbi:hypothetical protein DL764_004369 [Monosporascus ibericus]|uniref:O-methyltransferase domain-containing protein n=1 Tax=Monosporascus ibericus TaxID=155417 RepID=A0A4Q4TCW0_9PEZI|nr:hypothetical protein DL764_004369 [Monosporascus ibericus]
MDKTLQGLIDTLKSTLLDLRSDADGGSLQAALHDTEKLPDQKLYLLASEALDLLSEVRLVLEPSQLVLADHFFGYMSTKALCAAVELNIPDMLASGPMTLSQLASQCNGRPDRLGQVMRTLRNNGIFSYDAETDSYQNNSVSTLLLSSHWTQWRNWIELYGNEFYDMARGIPVSCKNDVARCPAQVNYDTDDTMFKYFTDQGWIPKLHETFSGGAVAQAPGIIQDYPWEEVATSTVLDIGGGGGGLIASLLQEYKTMKGAILEVPRVIEQARFNFHSPEGRYTDVGHQIPPESLIEGDFFEEVPPSDVYTIKWCLHDWNDQKASQILTNIRKAITETPNSRLVVLESVLKDGHMGRMSRYADMNMMVAVGGKERDEKQWRQLAAETGWDLRAIYNLRNSWPCALEFVPVWPLKSAPLASAYIASTRPRCVVADMRFLEPWDGDRGNPYVRIDPAPGFNRMNFEWRDYAVTIEDARPTMRDFALDIHGFAYIEDVISKDVVDALRGSDKSAVKALYYPHVEDLVKRISGARRIIIFDHTQRKRRLDLSKTQNDDGKEQPATMSAKGAIRRLRMNIDESEDAEELLKGRVQMINVWRPLNGPVQDWPLATMDYRSVKPSDMYPCDLLKGEYEERGQTATFTYSDQHKWYYLDRQETNEVTIIKIWDSRTDGVSTFCAHAAFNHPDAPLDVEPRESVEVRCLVIY